MQDNLCHPYILSTTVLSDTYKLDGVFLVEERVAVDLAVPSFPQKLTLLQSIQ